MDISSLYAVLLKRFRRRRMERFAATFHLDASSRVLDVGGTDYNWQFIDTPAQITLLNLEVPDPLPPVTDSITFAAGDATRLHYPDDSFDLVFSNSVIEHMGTYEGQVRFANHVRRVAPRLWVQVPAREFPFEPHYLTPFLHWLPRSWRRRLLRNASVWGLLTRPSQEYVDAFVQEVRLPTRREMHRLFPDCEIRVERFLGLPKAYVAVRHGRS